MSAVECLRDFDYIDQKHAQMTLAASLDGNPILGLEGLTLETLLNRLCVRFSVQSLVQPF